MPFDPAIGADTDPQAAQWLTRETGGSEFCARSPPHR